MQNIFSLSHARFLSLLGLGLLVAAPLAAQTLTSTGATLFVNTGGTLTVNGSLAQTGAALLRTTGTATVSGSLTSAAPATLDLSTGLLDVAGSVANAGTTTATTGTLRLSGPTTQTVDLGGGTVGQLVVNKPTAASSRVDLPTSLTALTGITLLGGSVRTASTATLMLPAGATVAGKGPGQYVQGNLRVSRTVVGTSSVDFGLGLVLNPTGQDLGTVTATRTAGLQAAGTSYGQNLAGTTQGIDRVWRVAATQPPAAPVSVTLSWVADDDNGFVATTPAQLWRADQSSGPWSVQGSAASASARSFTANVSQLGVLTVSNSSQPLPVELVAFAAERQGTAGYLSWATASEKNSAYFEVEVSLDGSTFRPLGRVAAQGSTSQRRAYSFIDAQLLAYGTRVAYYRLQQVDQDGSFSYSPVRALSVGGASAGLQAAVWPNPTAAGALCRLAVGGTSTVAPLELTLFDATGRTLAQRPVAAGGPDVIELPELAGRPAGLYLVRVRQEEASQTIRVLVR